MSIRSCLWGVAVIIYDELTFSFLVKACTSPTGLGVGVGLINPNSVTFDNINTPVGFFLANDEDQQHFEPTIDFRTGNWVYFGVMNAVVTMDENAVLFDRCFETM